MPALIYGTALVAGLIFGWVARGVKDNPDAGKKPPPPPPQGFRAR